VSVKQLSHESSCPVRPCASTSSGVGFRRTVVTGVRLRVSPRQRGGVAHAASARREVLGAQHAKEPVNDFETPGGDSLLSSGCGWRW